MNPGAISAVLILLVGAVAALVIGIFLPRRLQTWNALLASIVLVAAGLAAATKLGTPPGLVFHDSFAVDGPMLWTTLALLVASLFSVLLSVPTFRSDAREAEYYALLLFSLLGAVMLAGANDVMEILLGVLLTSVGSYAMVAYRRADPLALEAVLKYYLIGALLNIALIYGLVMLYGLSGSTLLGEIGQSVNADNRFALTLAVVLVVLGLGFKAGYIPSHFWIPDVYQGATVPVAAFLSVVPKIAAMLALARVVSALTVNGLDWAPLIAIVSAVTMTWGNVAAFRQTDIRRLLGYSSISQTGYLLLGVVALESSPLALPGLIYYFAAYVLANLGAFAAIAASTRFTIADNHGLVRTLPWLAFAMAVSLLSLLGLPPLAGFVAKFALFTATLEVGYVWLMVVALINSVLSLYYYLRVIAPMFLQPPASHATQTSPYAAATSVVCAFGTIGLGIGAAFFLDTQFSLDLLK